MFKCKVKYQHSHVCVSVQPAFYLPLPLMDISVLPMLWKWCHETHQYEQAGQLFSSAFLETHTTNRLIINGKKLMCPPLHVEAIKAQLVTFLQVLTSTECFCHVCWEDFKVGLSLCFKSMKLGGLFSFSWFSFNNSEFFRKSLLTLQTNS